MAIRVLAALALIVGFVFVDGVVFSSGFAQQSGHRVALLIANSNYPEAGTPLATPAKDALALSNELKRMGFEVDLKSNLTKADTQKAVDDFIAKVRKGSTALFFFSGYGIQVSRRSYLIPTDAQIWTEAEVSRDGTSIDSILTKMNQKSPAAKIVIIDASRRNPYERRFRGLSSGLSAIDMPDGTLTMYAAATDKVANDTDGANSIFIGQLLQEIRPQGASAETVFNRTRVGVSKMTNGEQVPWVSSSMLEEFFFNPKASAASTDVAASSPQPPARPTPVYDAKKDASNAPVATQTRPSDSSKSTVLAERPPAKTPTDDPAIQTFDAKLRQNPNDASAFYSRGLIYARNGDFQRAVSDFDQAIRLTPNDAEAFNNRCWGRAMLGDLDLALKDCNEALRLRSDFADALDSRGLVYLKLRLNENAINDYNSALRIKPNQASSLYGRGIAKLRIGKNAEGNNDVAAAKSINANIADEFTGYGIR